LRSEMDATKSAPVGPTVRLTRHLRYPTSDADYSATTPSTNEQRIAVWPSTAPLATSAASMLDIRAAVRPLAVHLATHATVEVASRMLCRSTQARRKCAHTDQPTPDIPSLGTPRNGSPPERRPRSSPPSRRRTGPRRPTTQRSQPRARTAWPLARSTRRAPSLKT
jgi:hypothetical protein